ncbi:MAG: DNA topoisomerase I [Candidatus Zambryskibacteria bacterium RIFCSPLOWO2_02_FULL_39_26]|uniref:DNA topoisomerase 1 n=1 Tax=Candidatus Zambryskibacteria bacterium RIFCSPLOWO2_12_FULL_39_23 TaxID=1802776 RepID=A0A1G2USP0_9BACT|nr:MAG: DNA topoisomerase I [Candidatus Zambryskibacteria bacterium RIFCSPHIGHO2_12_FULL_39_47]OHB09366.1 MAG: DNA topoisomerase I [Candidatus Zambryskibacteria bacterium RIFCSPLOWO2_02_FULL_39_26]OHB12348.1 MAG: DNA topoisomerase I [Candidatus Zambryskibacteria bacterium RIFCSPLOWO2_12_FULL_39_23]
MKLLIVESPAKAKTISKYLDGKYEVVASVGHIRDLPKSNKKAIDIEGGFIPHYEISKGKERIVAELRHLADKADEILLATDPDREGEAIAWHIAQATDLKRPKRVVFHEITKEAVIEALEHPREIDDNLKQAQEARRVLDRLVGYDLSGLIWKKVRYGLSAGRVQSPALRIIMEREREIRAFKSHTFWVISADVESPTKAPFIVICEDEPTDKKVLDDIVKKAENGKWKVLDVKETAVKKSTRPPFITSTLQQTASSRLGFSPSRTMGIAQKLYESGFITYMRTDSTNLSQVAIAQIAQTIEKKFGKENLQIRTYTAKSKNAQEAHEAIRPTHFNVEKAGHTDEQKKLYELIWRRALSSQMKDADTLRTKITANVRDTNTRMNTNDTNETQIPNFSATGSQVKSPGWLLADPASRGEDVELPKVHQGETLILKRVNTEEKQTEPPPRYSEAGLIKELEKRGIGRPSTYASIIGTLEDRGYVEKVNKALIPTDTGDVVSSFLEDNFANYISDSFTAEMEDKLDLIAEGKEEYEKTLSKFYKPFHADVKSKDKMDKVTNMGNADPKFKCPACGGPMIIKLARSGKFLSCARYPDCEGALTMDGVEIKKDEPIGVDPELGLPIFVLVGKYGPYVQLGDRKNGKIKRGEKTPKPRMASIPRDKDLNTITLQDALKYLSLPRVLGVHPETGEKITASIGRFGPYIVHQKDFRSLKNDDVYTIELPRALEILKEEKKKRGFKKKAK